MSFCSICLSIVSGLLFVSLFVCACLPVLDPHHRMASCSSFLSVHVYPVWGIYDCPHYWSGSCAVGVFVAFDPLYDCWGTILILRWVPMVCIFMPTILCLIDKWDLFFTRRTGMLSFSWLTRFFTEAFFLVFGVGYIFELLQVSTLFLSLKFPVVKPLSSHVRCFILVICPSRQVYLQVVFKVTVLVFWV